MKVASIITFVVLACAGVYFYNGCKPVWQFNHLEQNARKVITGTELQTWATNLLTQYPTNDGLHLRLQDLGTNFPKQLLSLAPKIGPSIWVYRGHDESSPAWVRLHWGSGFLGTTGFEIGPTSFVSRRPARAWQPGVYFYTK